MKQLTVVCALLASQALFAQEAVVTLRSTVTGNQQQPKVMYLVPWQQPGDAEIDHDLRGNFAEELFAPIDRGEFVRALEYQAMIDSARDGAANDE